MSLQPQWIRYWRSAAVIAASVMALFVVWRQWPIELTLDDLGTLAWALLGFACVIAPDEVADKITLRGSGYSSFSSSEAASLRDDDLVQVVGLVILFDALTGWGEWLIWTWW